MRSAALASILLATALLPGWATAADDTLQNDGYIPGQAVGFQSGFVIGEMAASRFLPADSAPHQLKRVEFLFGGATTTRTIRLHVWADGAGTNSPGAPIYTGDFSVTGSNSAMQSIDLTPFGVPVTGPFRVGIEFLHSGVPSVARDGDGTITAPRNFAFVQGLGWVQSNVLGITGDWVIRAVIDGAATGNPSVVQNDGFLPGQNAGFQSGFVAGEIAASRLVPEDATPRQLSAVQFLFGGATSTETIRLHVWEDGGGTAAPGTEIFVDDFLVTGSNSALQEIDLSAAGLIVSGTFRVGIEFTHNGLPSVARDDDGNIQLNRNFIFVSGLGWITSNSVGLTGDWVIRAVVEQFGGENPNLPDILTVTDVGGDQGRQVRLRFERSGQDQSGAITPILQYEVLRRVAPGARVAPPSSEGVRAAGEPPTTIDIDGWDQVAIVPAHGDAIYSVVVPTLADSSIANGLRWSVFLVRAATAAPLTFYLSEPDSGYSVDNLPPVPPTAFAGVYSGGATHLTWNPNPEADLWYYRLHRGASAGFVPSAANLVATVGDTDYDDVGPAGSYYKLTAVDVNGNVSGFTLLTPEATVAVDDAGAPPFGLATLGPNPLRGGRVSLAVTLPTDRPARLEMLDVHGRRVASRDVGALGVGRHTVDLAERASLPSGIYVIRLKQGTDVRTLRVAVTR